MFTVYLFGNGVQYAFMHCTIKQIVGINAYNVYRIYKERYPIITS